MAKSDVLSSDIPDMPQEPNRRSATLEPPLDKPKHLRRSISMPDLSRPSKHEESLHEVSDLKALLRESLSGQIPTHSFEGLPRLAARVLDDSRHFHTSSTNATPTHSFPEATIANPGNDHFRQSRRKQVQRKPAKPRSTAVEPFVSDANDEAVLPPAPTQIPAEAQPVPEKSAKLHQWMENGRVTPPLPTSFHPAIDSGPVTPPRLTLSGPDIPWKRSQSVTITDGHYPLRRSTDLHVDGGDWPWHTAALDAAKLDLFSTLTRRNNDGKPKTATLNIATLQRLILAKIQRDIIHVTGKLHESRLRVQNCNHWMEELVKHTHAYCKAVKDLEYMQQHAVESRDDDEKDLFFLKSSRQMERLAMEGAGLIPDHVLPAGPLPVARDETHPQLPGASRSVANKAASSEQLIVRLGMASAGGLFVIVPMLIMANVPGKTASLVTTCIAMVFFVVGITLGTQLKADQVLAATAAYAAVLVVFVGTSLSETPA